MYQCGCFRRVSVRFSRRSKVSYSIVNDRLMVRADLNVGNSGAEAEPQTPGAPNEPSQRRRQPRISSKGKRLHIRLYSSLNSEEKQWRSSNYGIYCSAL